MPRNIWAHSRTENEFDIPDGPEVMASRYAVPSPDAPANNGWVDNPGLGYSPSFRLAPDGMPDATRLTAGEYVTTHAPADGQSKAREYWASRDADDRYRHSVEEQDADGWTETKMRAGDPNPAHGANRWARNPRETPPPEPRPTQSLAPRSYIFWRPFTGRTPHRFDGNHFSMADHRRNYEIHGMAAPKRPGGGSRNTYRLSPTPWDTNIVDYPPDNGGLAQVDFTTVDVPAPSRTYRLG